MFKYFVTVVDTDTKLLLLLLLLLILLYVILYNNDYNKFTFVIYFCNNIVIATRTVNRCKLDKR